MLRVILLVVCSWASKKGIKNKNPYTTKHFEYVELLCWIAIKSNLMNITAQLTMNNMGIRTRCKCINYGVFVFLFTFRVCIAILMTHLVLTDVVKSIMMTWTMNDDNWWKSEEEPFFTNESIICALVAWVFWICLWFFIWVFVVVFVASLWVGIGLTIITRSCAPL